jgi:ribosomal protein S18 acetylase RimI-like enzyme
MSNKVVIQLGSISAEELGAFFIGWTWTPTLEARKALVENSDIVVAARIGGKLIGIATVLTDGAFFAYLSYLEVLPEAQGQGIARMLIDKVVELVKNHYDIATITDANIVPFYKKMGFDDNVSGVHLRFLPTRRTPEE